MTIYIFSKCMMLSYLWNVCFCVVLAVPFLFIRFL